jgi:iron-sulfur cluster assembly protein
MKISSVLARNPAKAGTLAGIMTEFGIHCVGCGAAGHETLEQGVLGHGFSKKELDALIAQLNQALADDSPHEETSGDFSISLTSAAAAKVKDVMQHNGNANAVLRLEVLEGGCSGFKYELQVTDKPFATDWVGHQDGINIAVDQTGLDRISGMEIDYVDTLNESGFKFNNPKARHGCGCGKSFR